MEHNRTFCLNYLAAAVHTGRNFSNLRKCSSVRMLLVFLKSLLKNEVWNLVGCFLYNSFDRVYNSRSTGRTHYIDWSQVEHRVSSTFNRSNSPKRLISPPPGITFCRLTI